MIQKSTNHARRGLSLAGVIAIAFCVIVIGAVLLVALVPRLIPTNRADVRPLKDQTQVKQIHQAMLVYANETNGLLPVPGLIDRLPDPYLGMDTPSSGPEDESLNTTANLYSALIALEYFNPDLLVSPMERNPAVTVMVAYDYEAYQPAHDQYWDPAFTADLVRGSNVSYAHASLAGGDRETRWTNRALFQMVQCGSRGPADGVASADSLSCDPDGAWFGSLVFADNSTQMKRIDEGNDIRFDDPKLLDARDNPFARDAVLGDRDAFIAFTRNVGDAGPEYQHD